MHLNGFEAYFTVHQISNCFSYLIKGTTIIISFNERLLCVIIFTNIAFDIIAETTARIGAIIGIDIGTVIKI